MLGNSRPRLVSLVAIAAIVLGACGSSSPKGAGGTTDSGNPGATRFATAAPPPAVTGTITGPGVTSDTITIGQITTTSGPVPGLFQDANDGLDAYVAYLNANGGIDGHTIKLIHLDDGLDCTRYSNELAQLSTEAFAIVGSLTVVDTCGEKQLKQLPTLPDIAALELSPSLYSYTNVFTPAPAPPGFSTTGYQWIKAKFPKDITKVATLVGAVTAPNGKEQELAAESIGYKYLYKRLIGSSETNFTSDILRMKKDGVKIVDLSSLPVQLDVDFLQQANQQNLHLDAVISPTAYDSHLFKLLGNPALANDILFAPLGYVMYLGQDRSKVPELNTFLTWLDKEHPGESASIFSVSAWGAGVLFDEAMSKAGPTIDRASLVNALNSIGTFNTNGLTAPVDIGKRQGAHCIVVAEVTGGQWRRVDPSSGFECNGTYHSVPLSALSG